MIVSLSFSIANSCAAAGADVGSPASMDVILSRTPSISYLKSTRAPKVEVTSVAVKASWAPSPPRVRTAADQRPVTSGAALARTPPSQSNPSATSARRSMLIVMGELLAAPLRIRAARSLVWRRSGAVQIHLVGAPGCAVLRLGALPRNIAASSRWALRGRIERRSLWPEACKQTFDPNGGLNPGPDAGGNLG